MCIAVFYFNHVNWKYISLTLTSVCACGRTEEQNIYLKFKLGISKHRPFCFSPTRVVVPRAVTLFKLPLLDTEFVMPNVKCLYSCI
jgi:hypothetical protein